MSLISWEGEEFGCNAMFMHNSQISDLKDPNECIDQGCPGEFILWCIEDIGIS